MNFSMLKLENILKASLLGMMIFITPNKEEYLDPLKASILSSIAISGLAWLISLARGNIKQDLDVLMRSALMICFPILFYIPIIDCINGYSEVSNHMRETTISWCIWLAKLAMLYFAIFPIVSVLSSKKDTHK